MGYTAFNVHGCAGSCFCSATCGKNCVCHPCDTVTQYQVTAGTDTSDYVCAACPTSCNANCNSVGVSDATTCSAYCTSIGSGSNWISNTVNGLGPSMCQCSPCNTGFCCSSSPPPSPQPPSPPPPPPPSPSSTSCASFGISSELMCSTYCSGSYSWRVNGNQISCQCAMTSFSCSSSPPPPPPPPPPAPPPSSASTYTCSCSGCTSCVDNNCNTDCIQKGNAASGACNGNNCVCTGYIGQACPQSLCDTNCRVYGSCSSGGTCALSSTSSSSSTTNVGLIAGAAGGGALLLLILVIAVVLICRRKRDRTVAM